ncbi:polysaccharide pyruvyl transferase family protein [Saccharicrinis sp. FJH62]|uniref:polysaccharide pyruvyl transferase family protein n=1 Tax=Saccharicrinis sp. FJH62 TaxID=3344657 RepID=UPI0035D4EEC0
MKKIGIITVSKTYNFGAELQAFALQKKLCLMGYQAEIIDYLYFKNSKYKFTKSAKPLFKFSKTQIIKEYILYRILSPVYDLIMPQIFPRLKRKMYNFNYFNTEVSKFSKTYKSFDELYSAQMPYDVYIAGSDQLWNPNTGTSLKPYFLTFAPNNRKKLSYASSFGVSMINPEQNSIYRELLNNLDFISAREKQGVKLAEMLTGKRVTQVLDPTLLLNKEDWSNLVSLNNFKFKNYILIYQLSDSNTIISLANFIKDKTGMPIYRITKNPFFNSKDANITNITDAGPREFISYFLNASFIITNSFHGTAFSVNFKIPFTAILSKKRKNNSRIESFLETTNLYNRLLYEEDNNKFNELSLVVDFNNSSRLLNEEIIKSIEFLQKSIN